MKKLYMILVLGLLSFSTAALAADAVECASNLEECGAKCAEATDAVACKAECQADFVSCEQNTTEEK